MSTAMKVPQVRLRSPSGYVAPDARKQVNDVVGSKLGIADMVCNWSMIGPDATVTYTVKERPPSVVGLVDIMEAIARCSEWEFVVGLAAGGKPVIISLDDDSPHIACSAGSGAGKSILAMILGIQVLRKGGRVLIIDRKGSHRWARGLSGVTYCTKVADMHSALIGTASLADARNTQAIEEPEGWDPGERVFVIFEEMNATVAQLKAYWEQVREKPDPKFSPAIQAFRDMMYMGRSAKVNLFGVAQMLTATTTGGPEARENFGIRCLARYTANNWKMLVPQCAMPRRSKVRGRWQICIGDDVYETQVAFPATPDGRLDVDAVRAFTQWEGEGEAALRPAPVVGPDPVLRAVTVGPPRRADSDDPRTQPPTVGLREAIRQGVLRGSVEAVRHRRKTDQRFPMPVGTRGTEKLYNPQDLVRWQKELDARELDRP
ncbi:MAG: helicase HerA domain-containing protein [Candidatus Dormibacteria bacterium]